MKIHEIPQLAIGWQILAQSGGKLKNHEKPGFGMQTSAKRESHSS